MNLGGIAPMALVIGIVLTGVLLKPWRVSEWEEEEEGWR